MSAGSAIFELTAGSNCAFPDVFRPQASVGRAGRIVNMDDAYTTVGQKAYIELVERGSRFIATAQPLHEVSGADGMLAEIKKELYDATHHCFAYRIGVLGETFRYNDGGEPAGTAGKPILGAIEHAGLTDVLVVVSRYFGGTKLGAGGLARAYGAAAGEALRQAGSVTRFIVETIEAAFPHAEVGHAMHVVSSLGARIIDTTYDEEVHLKLQIRRSKATELRSSLTDRTSGNIRFHPS